MFRIYYLLMFIVLFITGCGYLDGHRDEDMEIVAAHIVSISESRPAKVVIAGHGLNNNTCVNSTGKLSAKLKGNKIRLSAKKEVPIGPGGCGDAITEIYAEDTISLDEGEYAIVGNDDTELGRFRIEQDAAYVDVDIVNFSLIIFPPSSEAEGQEDITFNLKLGVDLYLYNEIFYLNECVPDIKVDINRSGDIVNIDISRVVPITDTGCKIRVDPYEAMERRSNPSKRRSFEPYNTQIELGTFSKGSYRMTINGSEHPFDLPMNSN